MLRFGFRVSLNFQTSNRANPDFYEDVSPGSVTGAYKSRQDEFFDNGTINESPKKNLTPSMVKLPPSSKINPTEQAANIRPTKSTSDIPLATNLPPNLQTNSQVSSDPRGRISDTGKENKKLNSRDQKKQDKKRQEEQKKLLKKQQEEQKKRDKLAAQEQAKQEKLRKEREKVEAQQRAKEIKRMERENKSKPKAKERGNVKTQKPAANPLAQGPTASPLPQGIQAQPKTDNSTNTLESSISKASGPPPYTQTKTQPELVRNENDRTGNVSFVKPAEGGASSWDMISQHRQQVNRQIVSAARGKPKQTVMDLQYNMGKSDESSGDENSLTRKSKSEA